MGGEEKGSGGVRNGQEKCKGGVEGKSR